MQEWANIPMLIKELEDQISGVEFELTLIPEARPLLDLTEYINAVGDAKEARRQVQAIEANTKKIARHSQEGMGNGKGSCNRRHNKSRPEKVEDPSDKIAEVSVKISQPFGDIASRFTAARAARDKISILSMHVQDVKQKLDETESRYNAMKETGANAEQRVKELREEMSTIAKAVEVANQEWRDVEQESASTKFTRLRLRVHSRTYAMDLPSQKKMPRRSTRYVFALPGCAVSPNALARVACSLS